MSLTIRRKVRDDRPKATAYLCPEWVGLVNKASRIRFTFLGVLTIRPQLGGFFFYADAVVRKFWTHVFNELRDDTGARGCNLNSVRNKRMLFMYDCVAKNDSHRNARSLALHFSMVTDVYTNWNLHSSPSTSSDFKRVQRCCLHKRKHWNVSGFFAPPYIIIMTVLVTMSILLMVWQSIRNITYKLRKYWVMQ